MLKELERPFEKYQSAKNDLLNFTSSLSQTQQTYKPDSETWSVLEIIEHLILVEEVSLRGIQKRLEEKSAIKPAGLSTWFRSFLLNTGLRINVKYKAPSKRVHPENPQSLVDLNQRWEKSNNVLTQFISGFSDSDLNLPVYRHPRGGDITLTYGLEFFLEHLNHHLQQIERIKKSEGFPK